MIIALLACCLVAWSTPSSLFSTWLNSSVLLSSPSFAGELEGVLAQGGHTAEVALLRALGPLASSASEAQAQWLLQRAQLMLATMHQRAACGERSAPWF